jgi:hypothetical protein
LPRGSALALALALIGVPILCGAVFFMAARPAQTPGVYVEIADGLFRLPDCGGGTSPATDVSSTAAVAPGEIRSFYLVLPDEASAANAEAAKLYLRVVNHAEPQADYGRAALPTTVDRMKARIYRVRSDRGLRWDPQGLPHTLYREALSRMVGNRATTEVLLELDVPGGAAASCRYALTLGPPPSLSDPPVRWFVPVTEKRP